MCTLILISLLATATLAQAVADPSKPTFAALTMDRTKIVTASRRGKVVAVNLWFINCPNCVQEIKLLNALVDEYKGTSNVAFIGLALSKRADLEKYTPSSTRSHLTPA